jgi:apolipoprotein N-acyltransferase
MGHFFDLRLLFIYRKPELLHSHAEVILSMLTSKLQKTLYLLAGLALLTLALGDWPMVLPGLLFSYFLLRFYRSQKNVPELVALWIGLLIAGYIAQSNRNSFFPFLVRIVSPLVNTFTMMLLLGLDRFFYRRCRAFIQCLVFPLCFTGLEFLMSLVFSVWSAPLGFSQLDNPLFIQTTSLFGIFFLGFAAAYTGSFLNWLQDQNWDREKIKKPVIITLSLGFVLSLYGNVQLKQQPDRTTVRLAGITAESPSSNDLTRTDYNYWKGRVATHGMLGLAIAQTAKAAKRGAKIIVWAESYRLINQIQEESLLNQLSTLAVKHRVYILASYLVLKSEPCSSKLMHNKAVMIEPSGKAAFHYRKSHLTQGFENAMIEPGARQIPYVDTPYGRIGTVICYDMSFPEYIRRAGANRIDLLLVPGYDWQGVTPLATQMSAVIALQNRIALLRVSSFGLSAAYDCYGRNLGQLNYFSTPERTFFCDIPVKRGFSFYAAAGWLFPYAVLLMLGIISLLAFCSGFNFICKEKSMLINLESPMRPPGL